MSSTWPGSRTSSKSGRSPPTALVAAPTICGGMCRSRSELAVSLPPSPGSRQWFVGRTRRYRVRAGHIVLVARIPTTGPNGDDRADDRDQEPDCHGYQDHLSHLGPPARTVTLATAGSTLAWPVGGERWHEVAGQARDHNPLTTCASGKPRWSGGARRPLRRHPAWSGSAIAPTPVSRVAQSVIA